MLAVTVMGKHEDLHIKFSSETLRDMGLYDARVLIENIVKENEKVVLKESQEEIIQMMALIIQEDKEIKDWRQVHASVREEIIRSNVKKGFHRVINRLLDIEGADQKKVHEAFAKINKRLDDSKHA